MTDPVRSSDNRIQFYLALGLIVLFLSVWKGEPHRGYYDISEYLDNAESLWLKMRSVQTRTYYNNRYPIGLILLSGPFVYAGDGIQKLSWGMVNRRSIISLIVPILSVFGCLLFYNIGCEFGFSATVSIWSVLLFGVGSSFLTFTRLYYTDIGTVFCFFWATWAVLRAKEPGRWQQLWWLSAGLGLAGVTLCHYGSYMISIGMWMGISIAFLKPSVDGHPQKFRSWVIFCAGSAAGATVLMCWNYSQFGHPLRFGYDQYAADGKFSIYSLSYILRNLPKMAAAVTRNLWLPPAVACLLVARRQPLSVAFGAAFVGQIIAWLCCSEYTMFPGRYFLPVVAVGSMGLLSLGEWLDRISGYRGLFYSGLALILTNMALFIRGDDIWPSFFIDPRNGSDVRCHVWYMTPFSPSEEQLWGTRVGTVQIAVLSALVILGVIFIALALRLARQKDFHFAPRSAS